MLWAGPPVLLYGSYVISMGSHLPAREAVGPSHIYLLSEGQQTDLKAILNDPTPDPLSVACVHKAYEYREKVTSNFRTLVASPFVITGDVPIERLRSLHNEVILPAAEAMWLTYFHQRPDQPIVIVLTSSEKTFQDLAWAWDQRRPRGYYGYYLRDQHRMVVNLTTGSGTLTHELTHALSQADCQNLPEWFDEGLASLHEHCEIDETGRLIGLSNWRSRLLKDIVTRTGKLPISFEDLTRTGIPRDADQQLQYALSRTLCLWLQQQDTLNSYYKSLKQNQDPFAALLKATHSRTPADLEKAFTNSLLSSQLD